MRAVTVTLPEGGGEVLLRMYDERDVKDGFTPGRVEVDYRSGRTWIPVSLLGGSFTVEEPQRSRRETAEHYALLAAEAAATSKQGPAA